MYSRKIRLFYANAEWAGRHIYWHCCRGRGRGRRRRRRGDDDDDDDDDSHVYTFSFLS